MRVKLHIGFLMNLAHLHFGKQWNIWTTTTEPFFVKGRQTTRGTSSWRAPEILFVLRIEQLPQDSRVSSVLLLRQVSLVEVEGSPVETGEVKEEEPLPPTNPRLPGNLDPVASATRWDTPESPVHSGDAKTTSQCGNRVRFSSDSQQFRPLATHVTFLLWLYQINAAWHESLPSFGEKKGKKRTLQKFKTSTNNIGKQRRDILAGFPKTLHCSSKDVPCNC